MNKPSISQNFLPNNRKILHTILKLFFFTVQDVHVLIISRDNVLFSLFSAFSGVFCIVNTHHVMLFNKLTFSCKHFISQYTFYLVYPLQKLIEKNIGLWFILLIIYYTPTIRTIKRLIPNRKTLSLWINNSKINPVHFVWQALINNLLNDLRRLFN